MSIKHHLKHSIIMELKTNKEGSHSTRAVRKKRLLLIASQLIEGGYKIEHLKQLKFKHIKFLVNYWLQQGLTAGTIKNRMTDLRWVLKKYNKADLIPAKNAALNIPKRCYVTYKDKAFTLSEGDLSKVIDSNAKISLILQREYKSAKN